MRSERNDLERLEQELDGSAYQALLRRLQRKHLFFRGFRTWAEVITLMRNGTSTDPRKDEVLRPIFEAHGEDEHAVAGSERALVREVTERRGDGRSDDVTDGG